MRKSMKIPVLVCALLGTITLPIVAGTPEQEKAFTDKYKKAFEAKDTQRWSLSFTLKAPTHKPSSFTK